QYLFILEQLATFIIDDHQCLATAEGQGCQVISGARGGGIAARQPYLKRAAYARGALDVHGASMLAHDLANRGKPQAVATMAGGEEGFKKPFERPPVHASSRVADGDLHIAPRHEVPVAERFRLDKLVHLSADLDAANSVHRLRRIVAKIQEHLLQLR